MKHPIADFKRILFVFLCGSFFLMGEVSTAMHASEPHDPGGIALSPEHVSLLNQRRRCVVNIDTWSSQPEFTADSVGPDDFAEYHLGFFRNILRSQHAVDSIFWCFGEGDVAYYPSNILPKPIEYPKYLEQGVDILKLFVEKTHELGLEAFYSLRMNGSDPPGNCLPTSGKKRPYYEEHFLALKRAHPDRLIRVWTVDSKQAELEHPEDCVYLWNYAVPEVRQYKQSIIRELAENYDLEGIELDFARLAPHLPMDRQWENRGALTDFMRSVRRMLLELELRRGRPILLAVRVPDSVLGARMDGMDMECWAKEQLVDIFVPGPRSFEVDLREFRRITKGTSIKLLPCFDGHHSSDGYRKPTLEVLRGVWANWHDQGADGFEFFNVITASEQSIKRLKSLLGKNINPLMQQIQVHQTLLQELSRPEAMRYLDKTFVVQRRGGGFPEPWRFPDPETWYTPIYSYFNTNQFSQLPAPVPKNSRTDAMIQLYVADDVFANADRLEGVTLRVLLSDPKNADRPAEELLEKALIRAERSRHEALFTIPCRKGIEQQIQARLNGVRLGGAFVQNGWLCFSVSPPILATGENLVGIRIAGQPEAGLEIQIEKIELDIRYKKEQGR